MSDWFTNSLPFETKQRYDGLWNVWQMRTFQEDGDVEFKWCVVAVTTTEQEAKDFITKENRK